MKTLDETIYIYRKASENDRCCNKEETQQLVEWLEELKHYKNQHNTMCEYYGVNSIEEIPHKIIDDFAEWILYFVDNYHFGTKEEILKEWNKYLKEKK